MTISPDLIHAALRTQALPALPTRGALDNLEPAPGKERVAGQDYFEEEFLDQPGFIRGLGIVVLQGIVVYRLYVPENTGRLATQKAELIRDRFKPLVSIPLAGAVMPYDCLRTKGNTIPWIEAGPSDVAGFALRIVHIPWYCETRRV